MPPPLRVPPGAPRVVYAPSPSREEMTPEQSRELLARHCYGDSVAFERLVRTAEEYHGILSLYEAVESLWADTPGVS